MTDNAWLIHKKNQGEHSFWLHLLSQKHGHIRCFYRHSHKANNAFPCSYTPLWVTIHQKGDLRVAQKIEATAPALSLTGRPLICAMYMNELLYYALSEPTPCEALIQQYSRTLTILSHSPPNAAIEECLRLFEWALLHHCGQAFSFTHDDLGEPIDPNSKYTFIPQHGFQKHINGMFGQVILDIHQQKLTDIVVRRSAKGIMRQAINSLLNHRTLHSRDLLMTSAQ